MDDLRGAATQAWPPFVLVAGLIMVGAVAHAEGLFERAGRQVVRVPGGPTVLLLSCMVLVALVTATLNLDTAVVFLTPVLVLAARRAQTDEAPFLYAALFMANASSLFLPGANLTNLLVLGDRGIGGARFASALFAPALTAAVVTALGIWLLLGRRRAAGSVRSDGEHAAPVAATAAGVDTARGSVGLVGVVIAGVLTVGLREPALPVAAVGIATAALAVRQSKLTVSEIVKAVGPAVLLSLFTLSVALGVLARTWDGPSTLLAAAGPWETVGLAALASITVNNLPAAVLLSAHHVDHARALLIGLNLGPNLAVSGSLSSYLWYRAAKRVGARPSIVRVSRLGLLITPVAIALATLSLSLGGSL